MTDPSPSSGALQSSRPSSHTPSNALRAARSPRGRHARGWLRHYAGLFTPSGTTATRLSLERDAGARGRRLAATIADRGWGGARSRPRMRALAAAPKLHYAPALRNGTPVATLFTQPIHFRHPDRGGTTP